MDVRSWTCYANGYSWHEAPRFTKSAGELLSLFH